MKLHSAYAALAFGLLIVVLDSTLYIYWYDHSSAIAWPWLIFGVGLQIGATALLLAGLERVGVLSAGRKETRGFDKVSAYLLLGFVVLGYIGSDLIYNGIAQGDKPILYRGEKSRATQ